MYKVCTANEWLVETQNLPNDIPVDALGIKLLPDGLKPRQVLYSVSKTAIFTRTGTHPRLDQGS
jgi:hypothetical protein